ncbi:recombinase family protein [Wolbachia endosymbiont (group A) of Sphaerophoria taeniata]|nr:recombinase family protein [Wolbachia endosymbiont (group A) of Sphaerophoria taeniata]
MEGSCRGKIYAANKGYISVMRAAPYGYHYINKNTETGQALFEIYEEEAKVVRKVFFWVGRERASIGEVCRGLSAMSVMTRTGKEYWDRAVVLSMLKNSAYRGQAAFGKTRLGVKLKYIRPKKTPASNQKIIILLILFQKRIGFILKYLV